MRPTFSPDSDRAWFQEVLTRCGRNLVLVHTVSGLWLVRVPGGAAIDQDHDFNALVWRHYDWVEALPGFDGLLSWSPARHGGAPYLTDTPYSVAAVLAAQGDALSWAGVTAAHLAAVGRYVAQNG